jgi:hypothetical protein
MCETVELYATLTNNHAYGELSSRLLFKHVGRAIMHLQIIKQACLPFIIHQLYWSRNLDVSFQLLTDLAKRFSVLWGAFEVNFQLHCRYKRRPVCLQMKIVIIQ